MHPSKPSGVHREAGHLNYIRIEHHIFQPFSTLPYVVAAPSNKCFKNPSIGVYEQY